MYFATTCRATRWARCRRRVAREARARSSAARVARSRFVCSARRRLARGRQRTIRSACAIGHAHLQSPCSAIRDCRVALTSRHHSRLLGAGRRADYRVAASRPGDPSRRPAARPKSWSLHELRRVLQAVVGRATMTSLVMISRTFMMASFANGLPRKRSSRMGPAAAARRSADARIRRRTAAFTRCLRARLARAHAAHDLADQRPAQDHERERHDRAHQPVATRRCARLPPDSSIDWRNAVSAMSPSTSASTSGASGYLSFLNT